VSFPRCRVFFKYTDRRKAHRLNLRICSVVPKVGATLGRKMLPHSLKRISVILLMCASIGMTALWMCVLGYGLLELGERGLLLVRDLAG
jgi:hypothetical protein